MKYSVVMPVYIPTSQHLTMTLQTLKVLKDSLEGVEHELVIVETGSRHLEDLCDVYVHEEQRPAARVTASLNNAIKHTKGEYIIYTGNDVFVKPGFVTALQQCFDLREDCGVATLGTTEHLDEERPVIREHFYWPIVMIRRDVWETLGEFDEQIVNYWSDTDYAMRLYEAGWKQYQNLGCVIHHLVEQTKDSDHEVMYKKNCEIFRRKHAGAKHQDFYRMMLDGSWTPRGEFSYAEAKARS